VAYPHEHVLEHGSSRGGRWLRANRLRIALGIALIEGLLVVLHAISWWVALLIAAAAFGFYVVAGRESRLDVVRQASWIAAASQALVVLVPVLVIVVSWLAIFALVVLAGVALVLLLSDRR
jgi:hypothetical protein